ncbi:mCG141554, partial [Mus musculus]
DEILSSHSERCDSSSLRTQFDLEYTSNSSSFIICGGADVMKQDAVGAVRSHNTVIFEDSTVWIFFPSSPYQDLPIMSNSSARVCLHYLPFTPTPNQRL